MPVTAYSTTAASNNGAPPNGAPEAMAPSAVNDVIRQIMADVALEAQTNNVKVLKTVAGTNTITADMDPELAAYVAGMIVVFTPANTNTGATTIAIDGLTALDVQKEDGDALVAGDLVSGIPALLVLDSGADDFLLINPQAEDALVTAFFNAERITSQQALPQSTVTTLIFNQENTDTGAGYDGTTGIFTAPTTGVYTFSCGLRMQNNDVANATINAFYFSKNNATAFGSGTRFNLDSGAIVEGGTVNAGSNVYGVNGSVTVSMTATDTMRIKADIGVVDASSAFGMQTGSYFCGALIK